MSDLLKRYKEAIEPLDKEIDRIRKKMIGFNDDGFDLKARQFMAKIKILGAEIDQHNALGEFDVADQKEAEKKALEEEFVKMAHARKKSFDDLQKRIDDFEQKKIQIASEILHEKYADTRKEAWEALEKAMDVFDTKWKELLEFKRETGCPFPSTMGDQAFKVNLLNNRALYERVKKWIHVYQAE